MKQKNLISVVTPTYNRKTYLREFVKSVVAQTYQAWELIIVDDQSTDGTDKMVADEFADDRIRYHKRPCSIPGGAPSCRNYGKRLAKGEFICFFDSDDWISPTCLAARIACIRKAGVDYCIFPSGVFTETPYSYKRTHVGVPSSIDTLTSFLNNYYQFVVWTNIYKAEALKDIWWDERVEIYQDFDFSIQCISKGLSFSFAEEETPDYLYREDKNCDTISRRNVTDEKLASTIYLFNKVLETLDMLPDGSRYRKDFIQYHLWYCIQAMKEGNKSHERQFLLHVESVYGKRITNCFKILCPPLSHIGRKQLRRLVAMLAYYIFFRPSRMNDMYRIFKVLFKISI